MINKKCICSTVMFENYKVSVNTLKALLFLNNMSSTLFKLHLTV